MSDLCMFYVSGPNAVILSEHTGFCLEMTENYGIRMTCRHFRKLKLLIIGYSLKTFQINLVTSQRPSIIFYKHAETPGG